MNIRGNGRDLAPDIGSPLDFVPADSAGEVLQFKRVTERRMRRAPCQAHEIFALGAFRCVGSAKLVGHDGCPFITNLPPRLAFQIQAD